MKTLWIIDLSESKHSRLRECIALLNKKNGEFWTYTPLEVNSVTSVSAYRTVCRELLNLACIQVNESLAKQKMNVGTYHVCVLGDITSRRTREVLPFVSVFLKQNWSKVLPNHPGVGVEIGTFFYVPSRMNLQEGKAQNDYAVFLESLNLLRERCMAFFYDYVVPFGDIQPVGKQVFPLLEDVQLDELIFQLLMNVYWGELSSLAMMDNGGNTLGAMGAAGYFYDMEYVKKKTADSLLHKLVPLFRKRLSEYDEASELADRMRKERETVLQKEGTDIQSAGQSAVNYIACKETDVTEDLNKIDSQIKVHPVWHFYKSALLPSYYLRELRYMPARLNEYLHFYKDALKKKLSNTIREKRLEQTENTKKAIDGLLQNFWNSPDYQYKVLSQMEGILNDLVENRFAPQKEQLVHYCKTESVNPVKIPKFLQNEAQEIEAIGKSASFQQLLDNLKAVLQKEPTFMALLVRGVLAGTTGIFCLLPLLKLLSPHIINLGQTGTHEVGWAIIVFVIPLLFLLLWKLRRHFKLVKRMKHKLWAYILLQLKGEMDTVLQTEVCAYYDDIIRYCKEKSDAFERLRNACNISLKIECERYLTTFFNRPLNELIRDAALLQEKVDIGEHVEVDKMEEDHYYKLLKQCMLGIGYKLLDPIPSEGRELEKHARANMDSLFDGILTRLVEPVGAKDLVSTWLSGKDAAAELESCIDKSYPVGLFVDNTLNSLVCCCRVSRSCFVPEQHSRIKWLSDSGITDNLLFFTGFQQMDKLVLSRFLNNISAGLRFDVTLVVELSCYYAYYSNGEKRGGCLGSTLVSSERLKAIDIELTKDE